MKKTFIIAFVLLVSVISSNAQLAEWSKMKELKFVEIRTTSDKGLVAFF